MVRSFLAFGAAVLVSVVLTGCAASSGYAHFGERVKLAKRHTVPVTSVLANPGDYEGKLIRVSGSVETVCENKGCWIRLASGTDREGLFVKFTCPVEGRLIPMSAAGRDAIVEGILEIKTIPEDEARHYAEEGGKTPAEVAKIVGPQKILKMNSPSAMIKGV